MLVSAGTNVNMETKDKLTPFILALIHGNTDILKTLVEYNANPASRDSEHR